MSKRSERKSAKRKAAQATGIQQAAEDRTAVSANVAWMLSLMSTIAAEAVGLACRWYTTLVEPVELLTVLSGVMLFVAAISGSVTLLLIPVVLKFSKVRPPAIIMQVAVLAGALPIVVLAIQYVMHAR